jgi:hypothetical protein
MPTSIPRAAGAVRVLIRVLEPRPLQEAKDPLPALGWRRTLTAPRVLAICRSREASPPRHAQRRQKNKEN